MQDWRTEKKSSDTYAPNDSDVNIVGSGGGDISPSEAIADEEAPLIQSSQLSHIGHTHV